MVLDVISGCLTSLPPGISFDRPHFLGDTVEKTAWLSRVEMADPSIKNQEQKEMLKASLPREGTTSPFPKLNLEVLL
jgi:hypothetical protein